MNRLLLQPQAILALSQGLLALFVALYLLRFKRKTRASRWLAFTFSVFTLVWVQVFLQNALFGPRPLVLDWFDSLYGPVQLFGLLHFAYAFLGDLFPRESKIALRLTSVLLIVLVVYLGVWVLVWQRIPIPVELAVEGLNQVVMLWIAGVFLRKKQRLEQITATAGGAPRRFVAERFAATGKEARALRAFALYALALLPLPIISMWDILGDPPPILFVIQALGFVLVLGAFVVLYINHSAEPTTFQVKLIGLALAIVLGVLGPAPLLLYSNEDFAEVSWPQVPELHALRFQPDGNQGYRVVQAPLPFDPILGADLDLEVEDDTLVALGFAFPYYGARWEHLFVDSNGLVSFGGAYKENRFGGFLTDEHPKIAPYYRALIPKASAHSGVFFKTNADKVTVTWFLVRERYSEDLANRNTIQLVLHADGTIDFVYDRLEAHLFDGLRGLRPGGTKPAYAWNALADLPQAAVRETLLPEGHTIRFEPRSDSTYQVTQRPARFEADLGEAVSFPEEGDPLLPFGFSFPFFGIDRTGAYVSHEGVIAFGASLRTPERPIQSPYRDQYAALPMIMPLFTDLDPFREGAGVYARRAGDRFLITWDRIPVYGSPEVNTVQLALSQDGTIDFTYEQVGTAAFAADWWGVYPGDGRPPVDAVRYLSEAHAVPIPAVAAPVDDFGLLRGLAYRQHVHGQMMPFLYMILGSTLLLLLVFPLLCRTSLIRPLEALLEGVRRVDKGDLDARVPVRVNDELGLLAHNFNRMASSLKTAREELDAYAGGLEQKVAERTHDLEQSLHRLTETQDQLIYAEKMASLGKLTAGIAHEIKNPLNFVNNFAALSVELADELEEEMTMRRDQPIGAVLDDVQDLLGDLKQNAAKINEHGQRADGIVKSMLEHARPTTGRREPTKVNALVEEYLNLCYHGLCAQQDDFGITFVRDYDAAAGTVPMVPQEIGRVLFNLLHNAFYAVQEEAERHDNKEKMTSLLYVPTILVGTRRQDNHVEIRVQDNGPGITGEKQQKIFEPFYTTKPTGTGTGLGLSISYDIVTHGHGGTLAVESTEGEGATFIMTLPSTLSVPG